MTVKKTDKYTLLKPTENSVSLFHSNLLKNIKDFNKEHLIIDFSEKINIQIKEIILFLNISAEQRKNGTSFVIIVDGIDIDDLPDEINVVPTLTEAIDVLEMDAIERDLGF